MPASIYLYSEPDAQGAWLVMVTHLTTTAAMALVTPDLLTSIRDGVVTAGSQVLSESKITIGGVDGLDVKFSGQHPQAGAFVGRMRLFYRDRNIYQVQSMGAASAADMIAMGDRFVEGFAFTK